MHLREIMEAPGEKLLAKMWETLADKGIGSLLKPWQIRREGKAIAETQADAIVTLASAERIAEDIRQGKIALEQTTPKLINNGTIKIEPSVDANSLIKLSSKINYEETIRKEVNTAKAILVAESILGEDAQEPPTEDINQDWLHRWREYAGDVSTEELQIIWGKLLAGEIKHPGKFSLRTLDFIRNISTEEALKIEKLLGFSTNYFIYKVGNETFKTFGIPLIDLHEMQNLGLITGVETIGGLTTSHSFENTPEVPYVLQSNSIALLIRHKSSNKINIPAYPLTKLGIQVYDLCRPQVNIDFLREVAKVLNNKNEFRIQLAVLNLELSTKENLMVISSEDI